MSSDMEVIKQLETRQLPDVIYLDPMYPQRTKCALVKKEMRLLRAMVGEDLDAAILLAKARCFARRRVVVKRPRLAPKLGAMEPHAVIQSRNTRFDIYLPKRLVELPE